MRILRSGTLWFSLLAGMLASGQASAATLASATGSAYSTALGDPAAMRIEPTGSGLAGQGRLKLSLDADPDANEGRDSAGLKQDTLYFAVAQVAVIGVLYASPESISRWSADDKEQYDFQKWKDNVSNPVWDTDQWWINYIMHPYWGGSYYVRASERGYGPTQSFWYSFMLSTMYEFGAEALFEPVSVQDLIFTPGLGFFVGQYFMSVREGIEGRAMNGEALSGTDRATLVITDPLGAVSRGINNMLGREVSFTLAPAVMMAEGSVHQDGDTSAAGQLSGEMYSGLRMRVTW